MFLVGSWRRLKYPLPGEWISRMQQTHSLDVQHLPLNQCYNKNKLFCSKISLGQVKQCHKQNTFFTPKTLAFYSFVITSSFPPSPDNHWSVLYHYRFSFSKTSQAWNHIVWNLWDQLLSLGTMPLRFIHVVYMNTLFFFIDKTLYRHASVCLLAHWRCLVFF